MVQCMMCTLLVNVSYVSLSNETKLCWLCILYRVYCSVRECDEGCSICMHVCMHVCVYCGVRQ